jgi:regulator of chromosome condensation
MERRKLNGLEPERLGLRNIVHVAAGQYHSFAVDKAGIVYAWGLNTFHQTGITGRDEDEEMIIRPQVVEALKPSNHNGAKVVQIDGGEHHSLFLFDNGELWGCGRCDANELGLADDHPAQEGLKERRDQIKADKEQKVKDCKAKLDEVKGHAVPNENLVEKAEEALSEAEAAVPLPPDEFVPEPVWVSFEVLIQLTIQIPFPPVPEQYEVVPDMPAYSSPATNPISQISAGTRHNIAVSRSGHTYSWGLGNQAQLGLGPTAESAEVPSLVRSKYLRPYDAVTPAAGGQHCVLLAKKRDA